jgi:hypothetical protein
MEVAPVIVFMVGAVLLAAVSRYRPETEVIENLGGRRSSAGGAGKANVTLIMQVIISLALLAAGLFMVLSATSTPQAQHWGYGTLGSVLGFWLKR